MEESGVTKVISVRLENAGDAEESRAGEEPPQQGLFEEEEVEIEEGRELPPGVDDPAKVSEADLRPIRKGPHGAPKLDPHSSLDNPGTGESP
jgi:chromosome segregation protein